MIQNFTVKFIGRRLSNFIWQLTSLGFYDIRFPWRNTISLRIPSFTKPILNCFLVLPSRILVLYKSFSWGYVLLSRSWQVIRIEDVFIWHCLNLSRNSWSHVYKFSNKLFIFNLHFFVFLLVIGVSHWTAIFDDSCNTFEALHNFLNCFLTLFTRLSLSNRFSACSENIHLTGFNHTSTCCVIDCHLEIHLSSNCSSLFWH